MRRKIQCGSLLKTIDHDPRRPVLDIKPKKKGLSIEQLERIVNASPRSLSEINQRNREFWEGVP